MSEGGGFFGSLSNAQRWSLGAGALVIVALVAALGWWALRTPKAVLFSDLNEADAGVIVAELDKLKLPYELGTNGQSILMPQDVVHKTRMALMARQLPLHGAVGFELFNNAEFGVSDFVQKVNYQRALQGELTRTILSIEQVQSARVHLALPDQALFRKDGPRAKASVTLTTRPGQSLLASQVAGIQRLVAASVAEVRPDDVTVVDQRGTVLSRALGEDNVSTAAQLDARQSLEQHLTRKASQLLERMFKPGEALVTVDVVLNHQQSKVVTESVLPGAPAQKDQSPAGVIVRERTVSRDPGGEGSASASANVTTQEVDYATGKRTEQVTSQGGNVARIHVAVVVRAPLSDPEAARIKGVIAASVGLDAARGDLIAVYSMADRQFTEARPAAAGALPATDGAAQRSAVSGPDKATAATPQPAPAPSGLPMAWVAAAVLVLGALASFFSWRAGRSRMRGAVDAVRTLTDEEREAMLRTLQQWLGAQGRKT